MHWIFVNVAQMFFVIFTISYYVVIKITLPNVLPIIFVAKSFQRRNKLRHPRVLLCRGRRPRRPVLCHKQHNMNINQISISSFSLFVKFIILPSRSMATISSIRQPYLPSIYMPGSTVTTLPLASKVPSLVEGANLGSS